MKIFNEEARVSRRGVGGPIGHFGTPNLAQALLSPSIEMGGLNCACSFQLSHPCLKIMNLGL